MGVLLFLGFCLGFLGVVVFGLIAIVNRADMTKRKRWNTWVWRSLLLGLLSIAPFVFGIRALTG